jgi:hypothetical protein
LSRPWAITTWQLCLKWNVHLASCGSMHVILCSIAVWTLNCHRLQEWCLKVARCLKRDFAWR